MSTIVKPLNGAVQTHREQFAEFSRSFAEPWHQAHLEHLYSLWDMFNREYWEGKLVRPHILLAEPSCPSHYGDHAPISGWGSRNQIRIRPSLLYGSHPHVRSGDEFAAGRALFVDDILLHETIHQYHNERTGKNEDAYHGHGPAFAGECNRVGALLGLPPVRPAKARGKHKDMPSCAQWPHNVRPADYYQGAYVPPTAPAPDATITIPADPIGAARALAEHFQGEQLWDFAVEFDRRLAEIGDCPH
jgi:hypothetical protein